MQRLLHEAGEGFTQVTRLPLAGFCCPLCLRVLPDCCASFAHYPAAAAAGRRKTLLCKKCNSFLGSEYEPDAVIMANRSAVTDDVGYGIPGFVMRPPGGPRIRRSAHVTRDVETGQYRFDVLPMRGRHPDIERQLESMSGQLDSPEVEMQFPNSELGRLGALSWGYLGLFAFFGYSFVLNPALGRVRRVLLRASTEHLGVGTLLSRGERPSPFEAPEPVLLVHDASGGAGGVTPAPLAIGAAMGRHTAVFPLADDRNAQVYDRFDAWMSPSGVLTHQVVHMTWDEAFGFGEMRSRLTEAASWTSTIGPDPVVLIRHDVARARAMLSAPLSIGALPSVAEPPDWRAQVRELPGEVLRGAWSETASGSVEALLPQSATGQQRGLLPLLTGVAELADVAAAREVLTASLPPVAASHALDMFRIFVLGEAAHDFDEVPPTHTQDAFAGMVRRLTGQWIVGGHTDERTRGRTGVKAAVLLWPNGNVIVGEAYTRHTLLLEATEAVKQTLGRSRTRRL